MSSDGVPIQDISDTVGHKSNHVTGTVHRHAVVPEIRGGATIMDDAFSDDEDDPGESNENANKALRRLARHIIPNKSSIKRWS